MKENQVSTQEITAVGKIIIDIIKADLAGADYSIPADVDFKKLYTLADIHRVAPLIAQAVLSCEAAPEDIKSVFKKELFKVSIRYETQMKERSELSRLFSENSIKHCFLKGDKLSRFYKRAELRFMLDMDVYVEQKSFEKAEKLLIQRGYELNTFSDDKDVGYIKKPFLNIELHKELKYDYDKGYEYYKGAFERLSAVDGTCELNMTNEDFYVYILSHSAHHFETAGTGIRNILDHYYLKTKLKPLCDGELLKNNLGAVGLTVFNEKMDRLSAVWFENDAVSDDIAEMSDYVLLSGVFGNKVNHYMSGILRGEYNEKKSSFILSRLFPSRAHLQGRYPVLIKYPFLLPFIWIIRIFSAVFGKKDVGAEIENMNSVSDEEKLNFTEFMRKNGL